MPDNDQNKGAQGPQPLPQPQEVETLPPLSELLNTEEEQKTPDQVMDEQSEGIKKEADHTTKNAQRVLQELGKLAESKNKTV